MNMKSNFYYCIYYKKLGYPQRERASNVALSYGAKGMLNRLGVDHDRRTDGQTKAI